MNPQSYYTGYKSAGGRRPAISAGEDIRKKKKRKAKPIYIRSPFSRAACGRRKYPRAGTLQPLDKLPAKVPATVSVCVYRVNRCHNSMGRKFQYLEFLLYKYPAQQKAVGDLCVFPFAKAEDDAVAAAARLVETVTGHVLKPEGFVEGEDGRSVLVYRAPEEKASRPPPELQSSSRLWWALIDEICNYRTVITFPVHKSVYLLFYRNPGLIYIPGPVEIPRIAYFGTYAGLMPLVSTLGQKTVPFLRSDGRGYGFGSFRDAVRFAGWTKDYAPLAIDGRDIADGEGRYGRGAVARVAVLLGRMQVEKHCDSRRWSSSYASSYRNCGMNTRIGVRDYGQYLTLSRHLVDMATLGRRWDPHSKQYRIE